MAAYHSQALSALPSMGQPPSLSCRLYRDQSGHSASAPAVEELRRVLAAAGD